MGQKHYTIETWKEKATQVHNGKYTYDKITEYINGKQKGEIYCTNCEEYFTQTLKNHLEGFGHIQCSAKNSYFVNVQPLLSNFKEVHGDKFDYSKFKYKGFHKKSTIICKKHGEFEQTPAKHQSGRGCRYCRTDKTKEVHTKTQNEFIEQLSNKHPNKFGIDKLKYVNDRTEVELFCNDCEEYHMYIPNYILSKSGCKYCRERREIRTFDDFYNRLKSEQKDDFIFYGETFINTNMPMKITHNVCGNTYMQRPSHIIFRGSSCQFCAESGFKSDKDSILYYLKVNHNNKYFYKIGITNRTVEHRYLNSDLEKIEKQITFPMLGYKAQEWERAIINEYKEYLYKGNEIVLDSAKGNAELFTKDILGVLNGW